MSHLTNILEQIPSFRFKPILLNLKITFFPLNLRYNTKFTKEKLIELVNCIIDVDIYINSDLKYVIYWSPLVKKKIE